MKRFLISLMGLVTLIISCGSGTPASTEDPFALWNEQSTETIVFVSKADSPQGELYLLSKSGQSKRLTLNDRYENNPALSPDGEHVAFHGGNIDDPLSWEIYVLSLETGQEIQLTDNQVLDGHPDWSPDGSQIVFASFRDTWGNPSGTADIYVINVDGTGLVQLTDSPWEDNDPEWSPDGTRIVFKSTRNTQQSAREEIFIMDSDGSNVRRVTTTTGWGSDHDPSWSPDSASIVFSRFEGGRPWTDIARPDLLQEHWFQLVPWNIHQVDLDGEVVKLTNAKHAAGLPVFSNDGSNILFLELDFIIRNNQLVGAHHRMILMSPVGGNHRQLIPDDRHTPTLEYFDW